MNTISLALPPQYTPAPYLAQGSFLTSSQLVYYFQGIHSPNSTLSPSLNIGLTASDFYASLGYITSTPEYVFERLVGNLSHAFAATTQQERDQNYDENPKILEEMRALELSNNRLKLELAELKVAISESAIHDNYPVIGSFHTSEIRSRDQPQAKHSKVVQFTKRYPKPPGIAIGFTSFDLAGEITLSSTPTLIEKAKFKTNISSWCDTIMHSASCAWLEVDTDDTDFQCGRFLIGEDHPWDEPKLKTTRQITFLRSYSTPPQIVVWIHELAFHCNTDRRLHVYATDITITGFKLHVDTWGDSTLHHAGASWVACTGNKPNVFTGSFSTSDLRSGEFPYLKNSGYVRFGNGVTQFTTPPRIIAAINRIDISSKYDMRLSLKTSDITATGMTWNLDGWSDTILYSAGASFIALA